MINPLKYFFWSCAGTTISLIKTEDCETEHSKYVGIGAAVFLTGVLAGVAASYAFSTVFNSVGWAVAFGAFWGLMIFNLDRYLVLSIRAKAPKDVVTWHDILRDWGRVLALALPRVLLAALLAIVIAKPLELLIFEDEITLEMEALRVDQAKEFQRGLEAELDGGAGATIAARIEKLKQENRQLEEQILAKEREQQQARQTAVDEALGLATLPPGEGEVFKLKEKIAKAKETEAQEFIKPKCELLTLNNDRIKAMVEQQARLERQAEQMSQNTDGLATRLQAFSRLTEKNMVVWYSNLLIVSIILILEIAPILTKVYAGYGPYDKLVDVSELKVYLAKDQELEDIKSHIDEHRGAYGRRKKVLADIQEWVLKDTMDEANSAKQGSEAQVNLRRAKQTLIQQATLGLTHTSENGHNED